LALGTNSRSLKICTLPNLHEEEDEEDLSPNEQMQKMKIGGFKSSNKKRNVQGL
jgi:hypothetical protein